MTGSDLMEDPERSPSARGRSGRGRPAASPRARHRSPPRHRRGCFVLFCAGVGAVLGVFLLFTTGDTTESLSTTADETPPFLAMAVWSVLSLAVGGAVGFAVGIALAVIVSEIFSSDER